MIIKFLAFWYALFQRVFKIFKRKPKVIKTVITRDDILEYAEDTPRVKKGVEKVHTQIEQKEKHEARSKKKRKNKNKAAKQARKKNR